MAGVQWRWQRDDNSCRLGEGVGPNSPPQDDGPESVRMLCAVQTRLQKGRRRVLCLWKGSFHLRKERLMVQWRPCIDSKSIGTDLGNFGEFWPSYTPRALWRVPPKLFFKTFNIWLISVAKLIEGFARSSASSCPSGSFLFPSSLLEFHRHC